MIQLQNLGKIYPRPSGNVQALKDVTISIKPGEFVAVRGPSGCGKSTLLSIVGGLTSPTSGSVLVDGISPWELSSGERAEFRARQIGFVFQMFHLLPYLSVTDNVVVAANSQPREAARKKAMELLTEFGLADRLNHRPAELSAGERQRVAMARALPNRPKILLADEPTGNLDPENAELLLKIVRQFHEDGGTVLMVTHEDRVASEAGRVLWLKHGKLETAMASSA